jgi:tryptophanyl-tRNA synthetase
MKHQRILSGERPTGPLHLGHYFGTLANRIALQNQGHELFIVIADYQVLTDRKSCETLQDNVKEILLDYLACGLDPFEKTTEIFCHSAIGSLNQLLVPFLSLVSKAELERNPTIKSEIQSANLSVINGSMLTYPVHQAADILSLQSTLVPVGEDQLPHLEIARTIASRFNERFETVFALPQPLLSEGKRILGLNGNAKMSKSLDNAIFLKSSAETIQKQIRKAKTDTNPSIFFDPVGRPEVSNLLSLLHFCTQEKEEKLAEQIGSQGSGKLKERLSDAVIAFLQPIQEKRKIFEKDLRILNAVLQKGNQKANEIADQTLNLVKKAMKTCYFFE